MKTACLLGVLGAAWTGLAAARVDVGTMRMRTYPFRREELKPLRTAVAKDGHWKFRYLLAVLLDSFDDHVEAGKLLDSSADEPDESVFYH